MKVTIKQIQMNGLHHQRRQEDIRDRCSDVNTILPFKLSPHAAELRLVAVCGLDVVHDIDVDVVKHNARFCKAGTFPKDISEDYAGFGGGHLDVIGIISIC